MDYTTLIGSSTTSGSLSNWINQAQVQTAASAIITDAESWIYTRLRHWRMLVETPANMVIGTDSIPLPSDATTPYLETKSLYITGINFQKLVMKTEEEVKASYGYDGTGARVQQMPMIFYQSASLLKFDSPPDQTYAYELVAYQRPIALSTSLTNFLTAQYSRLLRAACMIGVCEFNKNQDDKTYWVQVAMNELDIAQAESDRGQRALEVGWQES